MAFVELTSYVDKLRRELAVAAEAGGAEARALAERLTGPLESAIRLVLLEALSAAAEEITRELAPGSVELRLRGTEPGFVVTPPPVDDVLEESDTAAMGVSPVLSEAEEGRMSRINFRLPEHLKARIEEAASRGGLSVNAWLIRAAAATVQSASNARPVERRAPRGGQRYSGWVR